MRSRQVDCNQPFRVILRVSVACLSICIGLLANDAGAAAATTRPNVIVLLTDDQGIADMSCYGNPYLQTPSIDQLYRDSVRLADFHVDPTCSPTRAALLTGRYSSRVGVWLTYGGRHHLRADEVTMADLFSAAGYRTAVFGKWHLGDNYPFRPQDRGFEEALVHGGGVVGEAPDYWGNDCYDDTYVHNGQLEPVKGYCTDVWFNAALNFIKADRSRPFFVYLPTNAAHGPHNVPWRYAAPFAESPKVSDATARFFGMIANIDENLGRLRSQLDRWGLAQNTLIIFVTDNGGTAGVRLFNAGLRGRKASAYEGGHRAACFWHWPAGGWSGGRDVLPLTAHLDLLPSLVDICGLTVPARVHFDGRSLVPLLNGQSVPWPERTLFVHHQGRFGQKITDDRPIKYKDFAVMRGRWRLVGKELYDVVADPSQRRNVAQHHPQICQSLSAAYEQWWSDISTRFNEYCSTVIGAAQQPRVKLTCQAWHGETIPYSQQHVRTGVVANGFWDLDVARAGDYQITLRRWPEELELAIDDSAPLPPADPQRYDVAGKLVTAPSKAIHVTSARLRVGHQERAAAVKPGQKAILFRLPLTPGPTRLQTWLTDDEGAVRGAYYVYVERIE